jgi:arginyl-tRNA synthetase
MSRCIAPGRGDVTAAMQLYATRVMSYLNDSGSQVRVLGIARSENYFPEDRVLEDYNGHVWPEYYYRMGRVVDSEENLEGEETSGEETVVAVPMRRRPGMLVNTVFNQMFTVNRGLGGA